ncbi:hypothetical protein FRB97_001309 [Tulasnella sp. 331]|nr:hypothetical protein FRB97_001309 [Tulasnella sp. 331]
MLAGVFAPAHQGRESPSQPNDVRTERLASAPSVVLGTGGSTKRETSLNTMLAITEEYAALRQTSHCPTGMYVVPSADSLLLWTGVLFVHKGYYASSILQFRIEFPQRYPELPPTVHFTTDVFHPLVLPKYGTLTLAPRFTPWKPEDHHIFDVLYWIKYVFKKKTLDNPTPSSYSSLYRESISSFAGLAAQTSKLSRSQSALFERDQPQTLLGGAHDDGIVFRQLNDTTLNRMRQQLKVQKWEEVKVDDS